MSKFIKGQQVLIDGKQLATVIIAQTRVEKDGMASGKDRCKVIYNTGVSQVEIWIPNEKLSAVTVKIEKATAESKEKELEEVDKTPREKTDWVEESVIDANVASNIIKGVNTGSAHDQASF